MLYCNPAEPERLTELPTWRETLFSVALRCRISCPPPFHVFRQGGRAGGHRDGGAHRSQSGLALRREDALHGVAHRGDGAGAADPGAGHRRRALAGPGGGATVPPHLLLPAGRAVLRHPGRHRPAVRLLHHGAEVSPGRRGPDEAGCRESAGEAAGLPAGAAPRRPPEAPRGSGARRL